MLYIDAYGNIGTTNLSEYGFLRANNLSDKGILVYSSLTIPPSLNSLEKFDGYIRISWT